jgi:HEAT repeat protein
MPCRTLVNALNDPEWQVRYASLHALGDLGGATVREAVLRLQDDPDQRVRSLAARC